MANLRRTHTSHPVPFSVEGDQRTGALWIPDSTATQLSDGVIGHLVQETGKKLAEAGAENSTQMVMVGEDNSFLSRFFARFSPEKLYTNHAAGIEAAFQAGFRAGAAATMHSRGTVKTYPPTAREVVTAFLTDDWTDPDKHIAQVALSLLNGSPIPEVVDDIDRRVAEDVFTRYTQERQVDCSCIIPDCQIKLAYASLLYWDYSRRIVIS